MLFPSHIDERSLETIPIEVGGPCDRDSGKESNKKYYSVLYKNLMRGVENHDKLRAVANY